MMNNERHMIDLDRGRQWLSVAWNIALQSLRVTATLSVFVLAGLAFVSGLILVQGQRDEARHVDAIVVLLPDNLNRAHLDRAFELYRRGYAKQVLLAGNDLAAAQAGLIERGVADSALILVEETDDSWVGMRNIVEMARGNGVQSILLVNTPGRLLLNLKMARDLGLTAYGTPTSAFDFDIRPILRASVAYWGYVLFGQG